MAEKKSPLLQLSTDIERNFLTIDGNEYSVRSKDELSFADYHKVIRWGRITRNLVAKLEDLSEEELASYEDSLDDCINLIVVDLPEDVLNGLPEGQKREIIQAFTKLLMADLPEGAMAEAEKELEKMEKAGSQ